MFRDPQSTVRLGRRTLEMLCLWNQGVWPMENLRDCVSKTAFGEPTVISGTGMQSINIFVECFYDKTLRSL